MSPVEPPHLSFRSFVDSLRGDDDLAEINSSVDPYLDAAAIGRIAYEKQGRAPLFNNLIGANDGLFRMLAAPAGLRSAKKGKYGRIARHVGLSPHASVKEIIDKVISARGKPQIPPVVVMSGSCKENKILGDQVDLSRLPRLWLHTTDGGSYIQTYGMHILQTPDGKWVNWSIARAMVYDDKHLIGLLTPPQHNWQIWKMWKDIGQDCPWALAIGVPPAALMVAGQSIPEGVSEAGYIGAMTGEPMPVIKCETNDLYIPANSEIVFEGKISITEMGKEGPFLEMHGYNWPGRTRDTPLYKVDGITYRNDPILPAVVSGRAVEENHTILGVTQAAEIRDICQSNGLPVKEVSIPFETYCIWAVVQIDIAGLQALNATPTEFCNRIGNLVFKSKASWCVAKLLLVGEDVDPFDLKDVLWAYSTRCRPGQMEYTFENDDVKAFSLIPYMSHGPGEKNKGGKQVCDCIFPEQYEHDLEWEVGNFNLGYSKDIKERAMSLWKAQGFDE